MSRNEERIDHRVGQELSWAADAHDLLNYHYTSDRGKSFIHPLHVGSAAPITAMEPADHPWHRGVWFSWKFLNGVNFWEEKEHGGEDPSAGFGSIEFTGVDEVTWRSRQTAATTRYRYRVPTGAILLAERRTVTLAHASLGAWVIDWDASFTAQEPICLDRTPICAQTPWGGYAGMSFRATESWHTVRGLDSEGRRDQAIEHQRARWVQISGVDADGIRGSVAMIDHPENPRYPAHWRYINDPGFSYINPSLVLAEPYDLAQGEILRLRYRVIVASGGLNGAAIEEQHAAFAHNDPARAWKGGNGR